MCVEKVECILTVIDVRQMDFYIFNKIPSKFWGIIVRIVIRAILA